MADEEDLFGELRNDIADVFAKCVAGDGEQCFVLAHAGALAAC
jgi:hypothetical protein